MALETPSRPPPPFMANAILNFHFDYLHTSLTFTKLVVGSSRKLLSDQLGPKSCMAQRIIHINKSHVAKVTFTARDGAGRRPLTSWRRIYFTNTPLPCLSGAHCHLVNRSSVHHVLAGIQRKTFDKQSPPEMYIAKSTTDQRH